MASTGNTTLPASLTISYLTGLKDKRNVTDFPVDTENHEKLIEYLQSNGVHCIDDKVSLEDCQLAVQAMMDPQFWVQHASLHPNYHRVKNWLWVHKRYRQQVIHIKTEKQFVKFHSKLEKHSEYEETQLFPFFVDENIIPEENLITLKGQHQNIETYGAIQDHFSKSDLHSVRTLLESYRQELLDHLKLEEETIVCPWLQLTEEQYKTYRSYLSWKYCFMY